MPLEVPLLYMIVLTFPYEVECHSFEACEEFFWDFDGHCIESAHCFW